MIRLTISDTPIRRRVGPRWLPIMALDRLVGFHGVPHVSGKKLPKPDKVLYIKGLSSPMAASLAAMASLGNTGSLEAFQGTARKTHDGIVNHGNAKQGGNSKSEYASQYIFCHTFPSLLL